jgi:hypothetical protein
MPIARPRPQSWQARVCPRDTRNGSKPKVELLAPPVDNLMHALVRNSRLNCRKSEKDSDEMFQNAGEKGKNTWPRPILPAAECDTRPMFFD